MLISRSDYAYLSRKVDRTKVQDNHPTISIMNHFSDGILVLQAIYRKCMQPIYLADDSFYQTCLKEKDNEEI